jgi:predicted nucleic acid-binding Zn ribbon protein
MLCGYGCGKEGIYSFKNGKVCCSEICSKCSSMKIKNSIGQLYHKDRNLNHEENKKLVKCLFCKKDIPKTGLKSHEKYCYLNPTNKKECSICGTSIKNYNINKTCSRKCGALLNKINKENKNDTSSDYRNICFRNHGKKCIICNEDLIIEVHHINGNRTNNTPENLIPLCSTHHQYIHHIVYYYIIKECIDEYLIQFKLKIKTRIRLRRVMSWKTQISHTSWWGIVFPVTFL